MNENSSENIKKELKRAEIEWDLERLRNIYKFDFFFAGLVFAIFSFAVQFPIKSYCIYLRIAEGISWVLFLAVGICALYVCGGFLTKHTLRTLEKRNEYLPKIRSWMWKFFVGAVGILTIVKIIDLIYICPK